MTQALNLANFANNLNTAGQTANAGLQNSSVTVTAGTGMSGGGAVALGSSVTLTNAGVTSLTAGTGISLSGSTGGVTISSTGGAGTVTSVATGNGLSGGTITTTGTLTVACPTFNTVGSYCFVVFRNLNNSTPAAGSNYSAGTGSGQIEQGTMLWDGGSVSAYTSSSSLSGTWKWMGQSNLNSITNDFYALACRVA